MSSVTFGLLWNAISFPSGQTLDGVDSVLCLLLIIKEKWEISGGRQPNHSSKNLVCVYVFTLNYISYSHLIIYIDFKEVNSTYTKSLIYHTLHSEIASEVSHFKENSNLSNLNQIQCAWNRRSQIQR